MTTLGQANPYFVRCIKPNGEKVADKFVPQMVLNQLKYSGMMETVRIRRLGYPVRRTFDDFLFRYNVLGRNLHLEGKEVPQSCAAIMHKHDSSRKDWQTGKTKVTTSLSLPPSLPTYLPTYLSTYLPTYLPPSLSPSLPPYLPTYLPLYLPTYHACTFISLFLCVCLSKSPSLHSTLSVSVTVSLSLPLYFSLLSPSLLSPSLSFCGYHLYLSFF